jgi:hypothetical protein
MGCFAKSASQQLRRLAATWARPHLSAYVFLLAAFLPQFHQNQVNSGGFWQKRPAI